MKENKTLTQDEQDDITNVVNTRLCKEERETIITYSEFSNQWYVDTTVYKHINKFKKQGWKITKTECYANGDVMAMQFEAPTNAISIRDINSNKPKRIMSEEHKQKMFEARQKLKEQGK